MVNASNDVGSSGVGEMMLPVDVNSVRPERRSEWNQPTMEAIFWVVFDGKRGNGRQAEESSSVTRCESRCVRNLFYIGQ